MYLNGTVLVNDKTVSLPHQESTILKVSSSTDGAGVQLQTHHGVVVSVKSDGTIVTTIAKKFAGKVCGLCGNMNNDGPDDFKTRHHIPAKSVERFTPPPSPRKKQLCFILQVSSVDSAFLILDDYLPFCRNM
ncbi:hypothetical protein HPB47_001771 [Ixodes persulcatus]|uniref:Uncharacterized protein n=1 Tax=Ixodes persulcatus TaxID=34615 RepID=A0AC60PNX6_IXOPE|nr:hypothetical protein HPB47_001771 [Ixodes persulcatus]